MSVLLSWRANSGWEHRPGAQGAVMLPIERQHVAHAAAILYPAGAIPPAQSPSGRRSQLGAWRRQAEGVLDDC